VTYLQLVGDASGRVTLYCRVLGPRALKRRGKDEGIKGRSYRLY
jgi:hypothetical protein